MKVLLRELWTCQVKWDQPVPYHMRDTWLSLFRVLKALTRCLIPRWYSFLSSPVSWQLHILFDASTPAFKEVIHLCCDGSYGNVETALVMVKTKVPTTQKLTIVRLELNGALSASKLRAATVSKLQSPQEDIFAWSDSSAALGWINRKKR